MLSDLKNKSKVIGVKQSLKAVKNGQARKVLVADDADPALLSTLQTQCEEDGIEVVAVESMEMLGQACGIDVGAAVVVLLRDGL